MVLRRVRLFVTPQTVAYQAPLPVEFSRQGYWSGLPLSTTRDLPSPGIEPVPLMPPALACGFFTTSATWEAPLNVCAQLLKSCLTLCDAMACSPPGSSVCGDSPGKSTGVVCHVLLQGIFPTQELNPRLFTPPELAGKFFTTSITWEALNCRENRFKQGGLHQKQWS